MVIMICFILGIGIIGATITLFSILHNLDVREILPVYRPRKKTVGATFWGNYENKVTDAESTQTIKLPKINTLNPQVVAGSELYAGGRPVKSANNRR